MENNQLNSIAAALHEIARELKAIRTNQENQFAYGEMVRNNKSETPMTYEQFVRSKR